MFGQFGLGEECVDLSVADSVEMLCFPTALDAWNEVVAVFLFGRDESRA